MKLEEVKLHIEQCLKKNLPSRVFLDRMRVIDEASRCSLAYNNPTYVPFYYWLGTILQPKTFVEIGFRLGLLSGNFFRSCKTVSYFLALQEPDGGFYSDRLGKSNIKDFYKRNFYVHIGNCTDELFETKLKSLDVDLVIINEEVSYDRHRLYYDLMWPQMSPNGIIVVDYLNKCQASAIAFKDFCVSVNQEAIYVKTDYGIGMVAKVIR